MRDFGGLRKERGGGRPVASGYRPSAAPRASALVWLTSLLAVGLLTACHAQAPPLTDGGPPAAQVAGSWRADYHVPGASLVLDLTQQDGKLTGSGTYAIEAGRRGTVSLAGEVNGDSVALTLSFDYGRTARFQGRLADATHLEGSIVYSGEEPSPLVFVRP
jgi:hypothetical protein